MLTSESAPGLPAAWATRDLEGSHSARGRGLVALLGPSEARLRPPGRGCQWYGPRGPVTASAPWAGSSLGCPRHAYVCRAGDASDMGHPRHRGRPILRGDDNRLGAVTSCLRGPEDLTDSLRAVTGGWWLARVQIVIGGSVLAAPRTVLGLRP